MQNDAAPNDTVSGMKAAMQDRITALRSHPRWQAVVLDMDKGRIAMASVHFLTKWTGDENWIQAISDLDKQMND